MKMLEDIVSLSSRGVGVRDIAGQLGISPKAVNDNIRKIGELCAEQLASAIVSLGLAEVQLDEFWFFVKKHALGRIPKHLPAAPGGRPGPGRP
ncbi:MAG: hypothetical protein LBP92_01015 [Deltaproteobacteria bacterium]|jgi:hypothetical protein|nr:hypothetical protein [Deltaproteobacteria bacterium]